MDREISGTGKISFELLMKKPVERRKESDMGKMSELAAVVEDLSVIGKTLVGVGEDLIRTAARVRECFSEDECAAAVQRDNSPLPDPGARKAWTTEEVRARLIELAKAGYLEEIKTLVKRYADGGNLTNVNPAQYSALMMEVEKIHE